MPILIILTFLVTSCSFISQRKQSSHVATLNTSTAFKLLSQQVSHFKFDSEGKLRITWGDKRYLLNFEAMESLGLWKIALNMPLGKEHLIEFPLQFKTPAEAKKVKKLWQIQLSDLFEQLDGVEKSRATWKSEIPPLVDGLMLFLRLAYAQKKSQLTDCSEWKQVDNGVRCLGWDGASEFDFFVSDDGSSTIIPSSSPSEKLALKLFDFKQNYFQRLEIAWGGRGPSDGQFTPPKLLLEFFIK